MEAICWLVQIYMIICVVRIIFSWIPMDDGSGVLGTISTTSYHLTEPLFATVRKVLPVPGDLPIDFSPAVVLLALGVLRQIVCV
jgi:uncharacterized protein YggT (Ycf19 family)